MRGSVGAALFLIFGQPVAGVATEAGGAKVLVELVAEVVPGASAPAEAFKVEVEMTASRDGSGRAEALAAAVAVPGRGRFELPAGVWRVRGRAAGYYVPDTLVAVGAEPPPPVRLVLYPVGTLVAQVQPPRDGPPPAQLLVRFGPVPGGARLPQATEACPVVEGRWRCAVPAGLLDLRIHAAGLIPVYRWGLSVPAGQTVSLGQLALRRGASLAGRIETPEGRTPDRPCRVRLEPQALGRPESRADRDRMRALAIEARSNERGWFEFPGLAPGSYAVQLAEKGFAPSAQAPIVVNEGIQLELREPLILGPPLHVEVEISPPLDPYGQPWRLRLARQPGGEGAAPGSYSGTASREGRWRQPELAAGRYFLMVLGEGDEQWALREVTVERGQETVRLEIEGIEVRGKVTLGDQPLAATLWFGGRQGGQRIRMDSDAQGKLAGVLPRAGSWRVEVTAESKGLRQGLRPVQVEVPRDKRFAAVDIHLPATRLAGEVVDSQGKPAAGAEVTLLGEYGGSVTADDDGKFEFRGVEPGSAGLQAERGDESSGPVQAMVMESSDSPTVHLVLSKPILLQGTVSTLRGPVPGAMVIALPSVVAVPYASAEQARTDVQGSFELRLPQGTQSLTLFVLALGYAMRMLAVVVDPTQRLDIAVDATGGTLVLDVPTGRIPPLLVHGNAMAIVPVLGLWARMQGAPPRDPAHLVIPNVEVGPYSLCVQQGSLRRGTAPPESQCSSGTLAAQGKLQLSVPEGGP
jgi:hypothetical protein